MSNENESRIRFSNQFLGGCPLFLLFILIYSFFCLYFPFPFSLTQNSGFSLIIGSALGFNFDLIGLVLCSLSTQVGTSSVIQLLWWPLYFFLPFFSNHQGATPLVLAKRRGVNKDVIRLLESLEEQEVKGFNRGTHSKLETMQTAESERYFRHSF